MVIPQCSLEVIDGVETVRRDLPRGIGVRQVGDAVGEVRCKFEVQVSQPRVHRRRGFRLEAFAREEPGSRFLPALLEQADAVYLGIDPFVFGLTKRRDQRIHLLPRSPVLDPGGSEVPFFIECAGLLPQAFAFLIAGHERRLAH